MVDLHAAVGRWKNRPSIADRIDADGDCWLWTGPPTAYGYGQVSVGGGPRCVHVVVWESLVGLVPDGLELDHLCRVKMCCNPDHLEPVTHQTNMSRVPKPNRCPRGHPYTPANTYTHPTKGHRACMACNREKQRERRQRRVRALV